MIDPESERPFTNRTKPGRVDVHGVEWWATDPYPTWYRMELGRVVTKRDGDWPYEDEKKERSERVERIVAAILKGWGVKSSHSEWTDEETQLTVAQDVLKKLDEIGVLKI